MLASERYRLIVDGVNKNGAVTTAELIKKFNISAETVRRDLLKLEKENMIQRVHGGAVASGAMKAHENLEERIKSNVTEKSELSVTAAGFIEEGDFIFIDSGSTAVCLSEAIADKFDSLTVVTHCLDVFKRLNGVKNIKVILCGGYFSCEDNAFYGEMTKEMLGKTHLKKAFVFPSAVSLKYGIFDYEPELMAIEKKAIEVSNEVFVLADSTKFEKTALFKLDDMKSDYTYITDSSLAQNLKAIYEQNGIKIYY